MEKTLSILGLIISVGSAALLLWHEMTEKDKARNRFQKKKDLLDDRKRWNRDIKDVRRLLAIAYAEIDPTGEKEKRRVEINTKKYQEDIKTAETELERIEEELLDTAAAPPSPVHFRAFGLLLLGFILQLWAEILKPSV